MTIGYLATSIGYYDQHRLIVCIGRTSATDENVQSDENVPSPGRKRPRFRATSTKMSYIPSKACQAQGRKRPRFSKDENVPHSEQQVPKCPTFRVRLVKHKDENVPDSARTKTSHIPREVRKRPRFCNWQGTKTSQIPFSTWKRKCPNFRDEKVPFSNHDATTIILVFMRSSAIFGKICENMR